MKRDFEYQLLKVRENMREEVEFKYKRDIKTHDELFEGSPKLHVVSTRSPS